MKFLQIISLLALVLFAQSCDPIPLDNEDDSPVFYVELDIDNKDYLFEAGVNDYFMQTEVVTFAPTIYSGSILRKINGLLVDEELALTISFQVGEDVNNDRELDHINSFNTGRIPYNTSDDAALPIKEVSFEASYDGTGSDVTYEWDYGDGESVEVQNPIHAYDEIDVYNAVVRLVDNNQCEASATNTVSFDNRGDCIASIEVTNVSSTSAILESTANGVGPFQYSWTDGSSESDAAIAINDVAGVQEHCVTITDSEGCQSINCIGIVKDGTGINTCAVQAKETNFIRARSAKQFNSVEISWRNELGDEYSSRDILQDNNSYFEIIAFEEYAPNAQGERTIKIDFEFSCTLYLTGGTDPIRVEKAHGSIAAAIL